MRRPVLQVMILLALSAIAAAGAESPGVYVILDGSGSMWGQLPDGTHKITAAKEVVKRFAAEDYEGRELAFRVYGHRREGDCSDTELVVPFSSPTSAIDRMASFADGVNPKGKTPISRSLRAALEDFGDRPGEIVLVSDGIETCDEDPCALVREWRARNVDIRVHVVGLGLQDKERAAMQCISDAAGTEYRDAQSADELAAGLKQIQEAEAERGAPPPSHWQVLTIVATNGAGERMRVEGTATWGDGESKDVGSNGHNSVPPGEVEVTVGVRTWNGNLYQPVTRTVEVGTSGSTVLEVVVPEPPSVRARFVEAGEEHVGGYVTAFQHDEQVLGFRSRDRAYVDPGSYEFRSQPNADNQLSVTETFADGDHKEIVFELVKTVHVWFEMVSAGSEEVYRSNFEMLQDGEVKYGVHRVNGTLVLPGTYDVRMPLYLSPHTERGVVVTTEPEQRFRFEVPVGHLTIYYQKADGTPDEDKRCFLDRKSEDGRWRSDRIQYSSERIPLIPGEYKLAGHKGNYDEVFFEMAAGEEKEIVLRDKGGS